MVLRLAIGPPVVRARDHLPAYLSPHVAGFLVPTHRTGLYIPRFCPQTDRGGKLPPRHAAVPSGKSSYAGNDLFDASARDRPVAGGTVPLPDPGKQDAEIVVDLGDRPTVASRVSPPVLLDRDRRKPASIQSTSSLEHLAEELSEHSSKRSRHSVAALRHKACRRPAKLLPVSPETPVKQIKEPPARKVERNVAGLCSWCPGSRCPSWPSVEGP